MKREWSIQANEGIEKYRKGDAVVRVVDQNGHPVQGAQVRFRQTQRSFAFGAAMSRQCIWESEFADYFLPRFNWSVFGNESKWYANESEAGREDYSEADRMLDWCEQHKIEVRGHNIFWEPEKWQPSWVAKLGKDELRRAVEKRLNHVVTHFHGRFCHWDVNNEMLHGSFFRDRLGDDIWAWMFREAHALEPEAKLFVNDFNILSIDQDYQEIQTDAYVEQISRLLDRGAPIHGIGIQGHVWNEDILANPRVMEQRIDKVASLGLPIWITEFDVSGEDETLRADKLELVYRSAFGHPSVEGIVTWVIWAGDSWRGPTAGLTNLDWSLNEAGRRLDSLLAEWSTDDQCFITDSDGCATFRGFQGQYELSVEGRCENIQIGSTPVTLTTMTG